MNNKERLASHYKMYSWLKELCSIKPCYLGEEDKNDWEILENRYPELLCFIEDLLSHLEEYTKREEELFDIENHILWIDYRDYKFKIYLDAERNTLVGEVIEFNGYGQCYSDFLTHLKEQLERVVDEEISCNYKIQLVEEITEKNNRVKKLEEENLKLRDWTKLFNCEYPFKFGE